MKYFLIICLLCSCTCSPKATPKNNQVNKVDRPLAPNGDSDNRTAGPLETIYFEDESISLGPDQLKALNKNAEFILDNPDLNIGITGVTANKDFKEERAFEYALYIKELLVQSKVPSRRIKVFTSYEEADPSVPNSKNKLFERVVFNIIPLRSK
jgi:outer membrane protein OmpA-like peptidoglycan-associated protein